MIPTTLPDAVFHTRRRNPALGGDNPFEWADVTAAEVFGGRRVVAFALPGAFTPACSETHLPGFERLHDEIRGQGVDEIVCIAVNDAFVMHRWAQSLGVEKIRMLPDGNGDFTRLMGMLVDRRAQGMGLRSWRYAMCVEDGTIAAMFAEPGRRDAPPGVPVTVSDAGTMLDWLKTRG